MAEEEVTPVKSPRRRPLWARILKWSGIALAAVAGLFLVVCTLAVWILTPPRLTPLVERIASGYMNADLRVQRVELTFWHTFPKLTVDVDSLTVTSHASAMLPDSVRRTLPPDADSLLSIGRFHGGLNLLPLMAGRLSLYDVVFRRPMVNVVQFTDSLSNVDIFPSSGSESADTAAVAIPVITLNRFAIEDARRLSYLSMPDSLSVTAALKLLELNGAGAPLYRLSIDGDLHIPLLGDFNLDGATFGMQGEFRWDRSRPMALGFSGLELRLKDYTVQLDGEADFSGAPMLASFSARAAGLPVESLLTHLPAAQRPLAEPLRTSMTCTMTMALTRPWCLADTLIPSFKASLLVPPCTVEYQRMRFTDVQLDLEADVCGSHMDSTVVNLRRFRAVGRSVDVDLSATVTNAVSDPAVSGNFRGHVNLAALPPRLMERVPASLEGTVSGHADFRLRASDFSRDGFHRIAAKGELSLRDFHASGDETGIIYVGGARMAFGSNSSFTSADAGRVDSLLTVSLNVDTLSAQTQGMDVRLSALTAGAGSLNRSSSSDTTQINPFGVQLAVGRLQLDSPADTLRMRLRNAKANASLRRYKSEARVPEINVSAGVGRLMFGQGLTRMALNKADVRLDVHMRQRRRRQIPATHADSVAAAGRMARWRAVSDSLAAARGGNTFDIMEMDSTERRLLMRWDFSGAVRAASGRLVTPWFPLRNRVDNVDLTFDTDSVKLRNLACRSGRSDFLVNGTVSNLRRALIGRRNNTLGVSLSLESDTVDVNELVRALLAGSALAQTTDSAEVWTDDDGAVQADARLEQMADTAASGPLLLPRNVDASFSVKADNIIYSDLLLHGFTGELMMHDGAMRLSDLSASTDVGSINVEGLYSAPDTASISFGLGMEVRQFRLDRFTSLVPAIDSLLPVMKNFAGIINADVAVTTDISPQMDIEIPTLRAAVSIEGDSLVLIDPDTFKSLSKWLMFKDKKHNVIDHMAVELVVENSAIELYPFMFDIDRYRLGVMGHNDLAMNLNYHVSVLKSPMPFKFGINIKGTPDDMKIRLGGAKFKENMVGERTAIADNTRINIVSQLDNLFRRGISNAAKGGAVDADSADITGSRTRNAALSLNRDLLRRGADARKSASELLMEFDTDGLTPADSLRLSRQGLLP
ncbi:MAG: hypothetical protein K2K36_04670 [Muribaculaceae bacterium]|nr:hypothetical protein [Muribaculaceae bacterium]